MLFHSNNCLFCLIKILFYIFLFAAYSITVHPVLIAAYSILLTFYSKFSNHCLFYSILYYIHSHSFPIHSNHCPFQPILCYPRYSFQFYSFICYSVAGHPILFCFILCCPTLFHSIGYSISTLFYHLLILFYSIL